ncbi:hypothetical protein [Archangium violaceum]|uniref:hypothetical protein n=1 Tax=Archangium violaceum TaxID=83451 RepID=UPI001EEFE8E6|nr:hypothetical protein [Archangium violaceum]
MSTTENGARKVRVVILTAITLEYQAALQVEAGAWEGSHWEEETGPNGLPVAFRTLRGKGGRPLRVAVAQAGDMGAVSATNALLPLVQRHGPRCVAMCGVCAGRPQKTNLGDVIVAERLFFHDTGKKIPDKVQQDLKTYNLREDWKVALEHFDFAGRFRNEAWWKSRPVSYEWQENWVLAKLNEGIANPAELPECDEHCPQWEKDMLDGTLSLTDKGQKRIGRILIKHRNRLPDTSPSGELIPFKVHVAPMGSGNQVVEDEAVWSFISEHMRKTLGVEMEAAALGALAHAQRDWKLNALVMKGVMDFANHGRDDHFKEFAARASAECLIAFLREQLDVEVEPDVNDLLVPGTETLPDNPPPSALLNARYEVVPFHERGRIRGMGALLRGREGAEGPRRAADGAARAMRPAGGQAAQRPWGIRLPRPRSYQVRGRGLLAVLSLNTTRPGVTLVPGPTAHMPWASPGAPEWPAPRKPPSRTPRPAAGLHTSRRRTRRSRTSVLLSNSAWSTRGVLSFIHSFLAAASSPALPRTAPSPRAAFAGTPPRAPPRAPPQPHLARAHATVSLPRASREPWDTGELWPLTFASGFTQLGCMCPQCAPPAGN